MFLLDNIPNPSNFKDLYGILNPMAGYTGAIMAKKTTELNLTKGHTKKLGSATFKNLHPNLAPSQPEKLSNIDRISLIEFDVNAIKNNLSFLKDEIISEINRTFKKEVKPIKYIETQENPKLIGNDSEMIILPSRKDQNDNEIALPEIKENLELIEKESKEKFQTFTLKIESLEEKFKRIERKTKTKIKEKIKLQDLIQQLQQNLDNEIKFRESHYEELREYFNNILSDQKSNSVNKIKNTLNEQNRESLRNDNLHKEEEILNYIKSKLYIFQPSNQNESPSKLDNVVLANSNNSGEKDLINKAKASINNSNHLMMNNIEALVKALVMTHEHFNEQFQLMSIDFGNLVRKLTTLEQNDLTRNQLISQNIDNQFNLLSNQMKENYESCLNSFEEQKVKIEQQFVITKSFQNHIEKEIKNIKDSNDHNTKSFNEDQIKLENLIRETNIKLKYSLEEFKKIWKKELDFHISEISANSNYNRDSYEKMSESFKASINEKIRIVTENIMQKTSELNELIDKNIKNNEEKIQQFSKSLKSLIKALIDKEQAERISADNGLSNKIKSEALLTENKIQADISKLEAIISELPIKLDEDINNFLNSEIIPFNVMDNVLNQVEHLDLKSQNDKIFLMFDNFHESIMKQLTSLDQAAQNYEEQAKILVKKVKDEIYLKIESDIKPSIKQISEENSKKFQDIENIMKNKATIDEEKAKN